LLSGLDFEIFAKPLVPKLQLRHRKRLQLRHRNVFSDKETESADCSCDPNMAVELDDVSAHLRYTGILS
jgi:hypothetical protein